MAVVLSATGETILPADVSTANLTKLILDDSGDIALEQEALYLIISRLVKAINSQEEKLQQVQVDCDEMRGLLDPIIHQSAGVDSRLYECELNGRNADIVLKNLKSTLEEKVKEMGSSHGMSQEDAEEMASHQARIVALENRFDSLVEQHKVVEHARRDDVQRLGDKLTEHEDLLQDHREEVAARISERFTDVHGNLKEQTRALEKLRELQTDSDAQKASRTEFEALQKQVDDIKSQEQSNASVLDEAQDNLTKLQETMQLAQENRGRSQELWRIFREETQELRHWSANNFERISRILRSKMDHVAGVNRIDELQDQMRNNTSYLCETAASLETGMKHKASSDDLLRLEGKVQGFGEQNKKPRQLLLGTKCLACDRVMDSEVSEKGVVDCLKERQQEELYEEVNRALRKSPPGTARGQEVLQYVAVHVGAPTRIGPFEARDVSDSSPGSRLLIPQSASERHRPRSGVPCDPAPRATQREMPPLVRIPPKSPRRPGEQRRHCGFYGQAPTTHRSVKHALASSPNPQRAVEAVTPLSDGQARYLDV